MIGDTTHDLQLAANAGCRQRRRSATARTSHEAFARLPAAARRPLDRRPRRLAGAPCLRSRRRCRWPRSRRRSASALRRSWSRRARRSSSTCCTTASRRAPSRCASTARSSPTSTAASTCRPSWTGSRASSSTAASEFILCSIHGAAYEPRSGHCIGGPCGRGKLTRDRGRGARRRGLVAADGGHGRRRVDV